MIRNSGMRPKLELLPEAEGAKNAVTAAETSAVSGSKVFGYGQSILKGVGVAGSFMIVDHLADQVLFGKDQHNGIADSINSALVPAALLIGPSTSMLKMGLVGAGAIVAGKLIGSSLTNREDPSYSRYFRQSTPESLLLAAEAPAADEVDGRPKLEARRINRRNLVSL